LGKFATILDNLHAAGSIQSTAAVFLSPGNRNEEYASSDAYIDFCAHEVLPQARKIFAEHGVRISEQPHRIAVCGASLGGLLATKTGLRHSSCFGTVLAQSPSYWWNKGEIFRSEYLMNAEHIRGWLRGDTKVLSSYPKLTKNPQFVVPGGADGSVYGNIVNVVLNGSQPAKGTVASVSTRDSVKDVINAKVGAYIGFGLLSQYVRDSSVKLLRLSYTDSTGAHVWPKPVHSSYLMMRQYPFPVPIYVYLKRAPSQRDLASGYMQFVTRSGKVQRKLFDWGIEPGYAKITLYKED